MFKRRSSKEKTGLVKARDDALLELQGFEAHNAEYLRIMVHVKALTQLIDLEKPERLSPNTIAVILGNGIIALIVVAYESKNVVTTKVQSFMLKVK